MQPYRSKKPSYRLPLDRLGVLSLSNGQAGSYAEKSGNDDGNQS